VYGHTRRCLVEYFGAVKPLTEITPADADDWRRWLGLAKNEKRPERGGQGLSDNTVRRRCGIARQFFRDAVRRRLIAESPFAEMQGVVVRSNRSRDYFVTRKEADAVLKACPDAQWQLLFALSRYGGLRCPSEHLSLTWGDVDFEAGRIRVRSPKTERHEGKGERIMPLFPELRPHLEAVRDEFLADFDPKRKRLSEQPVITRYRDSNANLRTQLCKIIRRAGLKPWSKLFQNLRATRATERADEYPTHVAADWLGHSTRIADKHYRQTTAEHFAKAIGEAVQKAVQSSPVKSTQGDVAERVYCDITGDYDELRYFTVLQVGDTGPETTSKSSGKTPFPSSGGAENGALDPRLATVIDSWPRLSEHRRLIIVGIAKAVAEPAAEN
jgi:integrase